MVVKSSISPSNYNIDPKEPKKQTGPIKKLYDLPMDLKKPTKVLKLRKNLDDKVKAELETFLKNNLNVFAWKHFDMVGISHNAMCHRHNIN